MPAQENPLTEPCVVRGSNLPVETVRGNPWLTKRQYFADFAGGYAIGASVATHPSGEGCDEHDHNGHDELFFVVSGIGTIQVDDHIYDVEEGDMVLVPAGFKHSLTGRAGMVPFRVLCLSLVAVGDEANETPWAPTGPE